MINIFGPANYLGIGQHTYNVAKSLHEADKVVALFPPFGNVNRRDTIIDTWLDNRKFFNPNNLSIIIFDPQFFFHFSGKPRIGFAVFETDGFTELQLAALMSCDYLLTPSMWGTSVLEKHGIKNFAVVHEGYDPQEFPNKLDDLDQKPNQGRFRFIHVGKWEERKGSAQVIRCFFKEFENDDAEIIMHCNNPFDGGRWYQEVFGQLNGYGFRHVPENVTGETGESGWHRAGLKVKISLRHEDSMASLYRAADCGVFPSRGEGWGLPIHECIASGTPAIVGRWSAMTEYIPETYPEGLQLRNATLETANDGVWFHGDKGSWYSPPDTSVREAMRWAFENALAFSKDALWAKTVDRVRSFTWNRAGEQLINVIKNFM